MPDVSTNRLEFTTISAFILCSKGRGFDTINVGCGITNRQRLVYLFPLAPILERCSPTVGRDVAHGFVLKTSLIVDI